MRIGEDVLDQSVASLSIGIDNPIQDTVTIRIFDPVAEVAFLFMAKRFTIRYQKLKVAGVGLVVVRIIDLIDNAMADGEPKTTAGVVGRSNAFLGTGSPAWLHPGRAKCN